MKDLGYITTLDIYNKDEFTIANKLTYNQNLIFNEGDKITIQSIPGNRTDKEKNINYFVKRKQVTLKLGFNANIPLGNSYYTSFGYKSIVHTHYDLMESKDKK